MTGHVVALVVGVALGAFAVGGTFVDLAFLRPLRRENARLRVQRARLIAALRPFVPVRVRPRHRDAFGHYRRHPRPSWLCDRHDLLGGCFGNLAAGSAEVHDEARKHFTEEHLTREAFERVRRVLAEVGPADRHHVTVTVTKDHHR